MPIEINLAVKNSVTLMPDNFVLSMPACRNTKKLPSFCAGTAESQLRQNRQFIGFASSQNVLVLRILAWTNLRENILSELPDHRVILVVRVIGVSKFSIRTKLKLEEFMTEFALVSDVVTQIEVVAHGGDAGVRFLISYQALSKIKIHFQYNNHNTTKTIDDKNDLFGFQGKTIKTRCTTSSVTPFSALRAISLIFVPKWPKPERSLWPKFVMSVLMMVIKN